MSAEIISIPAGAAHTQDIERAAKALESGALVAFPTETVYGLAANAALDASVERLREVKGREEKQPFTVHIGRRQDCDEFVPAISAVARRFIRKGWPGPLTLIFPVSDPSSARIHPRLCPAGAASVYGEKSVGIRFPDHSAAIDLLTATNAPIIASSANRTGRPAPTSAEAIREQLGGQIDFILDAGPTKYQKSSTIVSLNGEGYRIVRQGVWDERTIRQLGTMTILFVCTGNTCRSPMAEGLFKKMLAARLGCAADELVGRGVIVRSAGTMGYSGGRASAEAVEVCRRREVDISGHASRPLSLELLHPADYIFAMGRHHLEAIRSMSPSDAAKAVPLDPSGDIADPAGGTIADYEAAAERIARALTTRLEEVPV